MFRAIQFEDENDDDDGYSYTTGSGSDIENDNQSNSQSQQQQQHRPRSSGGEGANEEEYGENGPSFVLQYSTVDGRRLRRDPLVTKYARKSYELSFRATSNSFVSKCCLFSMLMCMKIVLFLVFFMPLIWCILSVTALRDIGAPILASSSSSSSSSDESEFQIPFPTLCRYETAIVPTQFTVDENLLRDQTRISNAQASAPVPLSRCIAGNNDVASLSASAAAFGLSSATQNACLVAAAIVLNTFLTLAGCVVYHRMELRRRVCAHFMSYGVILRNRSSAKRRNGLIALLTLGVVTVLATCAPRWSVSLSSSIKNSTATTSGIDLNVTQALLPLGSAAGQAVFTNDLVHDLLFESHSNARVASLASRIGVDATMLRASIGYRIVAGSAAASSSSSSLSTSSPVTSASGNISNISGSNNNATIATTTTTITTINIELVALRGFMAQASFDTYAAALLARPYSFFDIVRDLLSVSIFYVPLLLLLRSRLTAKLPAANFIQLVMERTRAATPIADLFAHAKWQADLDVALKAVDLYARAHDRTAVDEEADFEAEETELQESMESAMAAMGANSKQPVTGAAAVNKTSELQQQQEQQQLLIAASSPVHQSLDRKSWLASTARDGFILSWSCALTFRSGFLRMWPFNSGRRGDGKLGRWTSKAHPHELLMGTRCMFDEESVNAIAGVLLEHKKLRKIDWRTVDERQDASMRMMDSMLETTNNNNNDNHDGNNVADVSDVKKGGARVDDNDDDDDFGPNGSTFLSAQALAAAAKAAEERERRNQHQQQGLRQAAAQHEDSEPTTTTTTTQSRQSSGEAQQQQNQTQHRIITLAASMPRSAVAASAVPLSLPSTNMQYHFDDDIPL